MFPPDRFLKDKTGRYQYKTLFYYDCPQLWLRHDTVSGETRLFVNLDDKSSLSGKITPKAIRDMEGNVKTLKVIWENLKSYKKHTYSTSSEEDGMDMKTKTAIAAQPIGDAFLNYD